ncbi:MAG: YggS family pyridoxal phosphate-dependent enzyme [Gammaproteobacteria bacterium]|nr:YggS family pyridoxal phosphate-dependent enzyme [Gammaproteobacteria bacterium]MCH9715987.1 YggS family pyridoxal phosphate-dependent enzyme [Gammaproteobacteria bacterium]MCH9763100.1 YggS family pyridoxal phosphate-dependent enzyme [Gammaproteobacteria bacterium]
MQTRIRDYLDAIQQTALISARTPDSIHLLAVSKNQPITAIQTAFDAGIHDFGESYWQEAEAKQHALEHLPITWHFIGPIQSNKAKHIAAHFNWVHSLCRADIAKILSTKRPPSLPALNLCIQVNIDAEASKSGCSFDELIPLAKHIQNYPNLKLRGLMAIPAKNTDAEVAYHTFLKLNQALDTLNKQLNLSLDTLSMGMSHDFIPAIRAGSTWIRIGRGIFDAAGLY